jgi:hypothetical protein
MPRYYFPTWDGDRLSEDRDGVELDGLDQARALAVIALVELARDVLPRAADSRSLKIRVLDEEDAPAFEFRLTFQGSSEREVRADPGPGDDG